MTLRAAAPLLDGKAQLITVVYVEDDPANVELMVYLLSEFERIGLLTGLGGARDWHELRALGADRFLVKPIDFDALVAVIRSLLASAKR